MLLLLVTFIQCHHPKEVEMSSHNEYVSAEEIRSTAGTAKSAVLPDEDAATLPIPLRHDHDLVILIMYYREKGLPGRRIVTPPHHAMTLDPTNGRIIRFWSCTPEELGIELPVRPLPGSGIDPRMDWKQYAVAQKRFLEISSTVWKLYASTHPPLDAAGLDIVREYRKLFLSITKQEVAPFYVGADRDFFSWLDAASGNP